MPDDLTIFRFDVDEALVRSILDALPGVEPSDFPELEPTDERGLTDEPAYAGDDDETPRDRSATSATSTERTGPRVGETPPPGAGEESGSAASSDDTGHGTLRIAAIGSAVFAVLAGVAFLLYRRRSSDGESDEESDEGVDLDDVFPSSSDHESESTERRDDGVPEADESERGSRIDFGPIVGMAALAAGAVIVRRLSAGDQRDE